MVELLLERIHGFYNIPDTEHGKTPLSWAAENGHEGVAKLLLKRDDVSHDIRDNGGATPLELAQSHKYTRIQLLLGVPRTPPIPN